ncbi:MAG TPA: ParA family protein [Candidatus Babeliales bacterium]|nr:ParA family protein [Candidatus Babeliales bacterium]
MEPKMLASEASDYLQVTLPAIHKHLKSKNLAYTKSQNKVYFDHETSKQIFKLDFKPSCWSWQNLKGGVGKTHLSFATAIRLSLYGARVGVIDLDQQGNFTHACGVNAEDKPILIDIISENLNIEDHMIKVREGLDILPSRIDNAVLDNMFAVNSLPVDRELKKRVAKLKTKYDFVFIDCPPSLGATVSSAALAADYIVVPVDPERFSLLGLNVTLKELEKNITDRYDADLDIRIIFNKYDGRTVLSHQVLTSLVKDEDYNKRLFKTFIRTSQDLPNSVAKGKSIFDSLRPSTAKEDIDLLAREFIELTKSDGQAETPILENEADVA